jgi:hypothetical protein
MKDKKTKKCSGFGFLIMKHNQAQFRKILGSHKLLGREIKVEKVLNGKELK